MTHAQPELSERRILFTELLWSVGELLMMPSTWEVAVSRSRDSRASRVSSAIFFLSLVWETGAVAVRRGGFLVRRRFVLGWLDRPVVTQSSQ